MGFGSTTQGRVIQPVPGGGGLDLSGWERALVRSQGKLCQACAELAPCWLDENRAIRENDGRNGAMPTDQRYHDSLRLRVFVDVDPGVASPVLVEHIPGQVTIATPGCGINSDTIVGLQFNLSYS